MDFLKSKIIFMGTPEFAAQSLKALCENNFNVVAVVTAPDKKAGRGLQVKKSAVKIYAETQKLTILQPTNLKLPEFIEELKSYNADLQFVVAFRMLPEVIWAMPKKGTVNLHASLLPDYRGAAPINYALINGEKETGITTFFIEKEIDTGKIIFRESVKIEKRENAETLHNKLMEKGALLVIKTAEAVLSGKYKSINQSDFKTDEKPKVAPKIFKENCKINWNLPVEKVDCFIRGLSPYPAAWAEFENIVTTKKVSFKVYDVDFEKVEHFFSAGDILSDSKTFLQIACNDGLIIIKSLQLAGKKRLLIEEFLRGFKIEKYIIACL